MTTANQRGSRPYVAILLPVLLAGLLVACGGSDSNDGSASSGDAGSAAAADSSAGTSGDSSAAEKSAGDDPSGDDSSSDDSGGEITSSNLEAGCPALIFIFKFRETDSKIPFDEAQKVLRDMAGVESPIQGDLQVVSDAFDPFFAVLRELNIDNLAQYNNLDEEASARVESVVATLTTPEVAAAIGNIDDFIDQSC